MLAQHVTLPPASRPAAGLLAGARSLNVDEWWRGIAFAEVGCAEPTWRGPCTSGADAPVSLGDSQQFAPITIRQGLDCSALSMSDIRTMAASRLDVTREYAMARTLMTGDGTEQDDSGTLNASIHGQAEELDEQDNVNEAIARLEEEASKNLYGARAFIHVPPALAAFIEVNAAWRDGTVWRTMMGNVVIVSPGYFGEDPDGVLEPTRRWVYASGEVYASSGQRTVLFDVDRDVNTSVAWAQELGLVVFDPCWVAGAPVSSGLLS